MRGKLEGWTASRLFDNSDIHTVWCVMMCGIRWFYVSQLFIHMNRRCPHMKIFYSTNFPPNPADIWRTVCWQGCVGLFVMTGPAAGCWELHLMTLTWAKYFCFTCLGFCFLFFFYISYMWHQRWGYWINLFLRVYYRSQVTFISIIVLIWCLSVIRSKLILIGFNTFTV